MSRGHPIDLETKLKIVRLYLEGVDVKSISERFGLNYHTIYKIINKRDDNKRDNKADEGEGSPTSVEPTFVE